MTGRARSISTTSPESGQIPPGNGGHEGAWTRTYEHGVPVTGLVPITGDGTTGATVHFRPDGGGHAALAGELPGLTAAWPHLTVSVRVAP